MTETVEIYFDDLTQEAQSNLLEKFQTTPQNEKQNLLAEVSETFNINFFYALGWVIFGRRWWVNFESRLTGLCASVYLNRPESPDSRGWERNSKTKGLGIFPKPFSFVKILIPP